MLPALPPRCRHLWRACRHASARLCSAVRRAPSWPIRRLGWLGQPRCLRVLLALCFHVQQPMVGLPALVLPLAQLVLYPALQPAPLVHAHALRIAAAQTPAAQAAFSHQAESRCWRQSTELLDEPRVPSGRLASPTVPASRFAPLPGRTRCSTLWLPRSLSDTGRHACTALGRCQRLRALHRSRSFCT